MSDDILTPAHLLVLPLDNQKLFNFLDFNDIGSNTLKESMAFKKVKTISKTFNTNLITTPSSLNLKYKKINQTYVNDNSFLLSNNYGLVRQHNLLSLKSNLNKNNLSLDKNSFEKVLTSSNFSSNTTLGNMSFYNNLLNLTKPISSIQNSQFLNPQTLSNLESNDTNLRSFLTQYNSVFSLLNNNSDKKFFQYPLRKIFNQQLLDSNLNNSSFTMNNNSSETSQTLSLISNKLLNENNTSKTLTLLSSNQNFLPADQNLRQYDSLLPNQTNFNFEGKYNYNLPLLTKDLTSEYYNLKSHNINSSVFYKLSSNKTSLQAPYSPILDSNNLLTNPLDYDASNYTVENIQAVDSKLLHNYDIQKSNNITILKGKRDGAPEFLNSTY
jgi:hypothetical protein